MFCYRSFSLNVHSEVELPRLTPEEGEADVIIRLGAVAPPFHRASHDEEAGFNPLFGAFRIRNGCEVTVDLLPAADSDTVQIFLAGRIMAFLLRQRGWLPLHASGVLIGEAAVLFLGASGAGKSTTAAAFHNYGHPVITDDVGAVRVTKEHHCLVCPSGSGVRLSDDSLTVLSGKKLKRKFQGDKYSFDLERGTLRDPVTLQAVYFLEYGECVRKDPVSVLSAVELLSANSFLVRERFDKGAWATHLHDCSSVAGAVPIYRLSRPHSLFELSTLVRWVESDVARAVKK